MKDFELDDEGNIFVEISDSMRLLISPRNGQLQKKKVVKEIQELFSPTYTIEVRA